MGSLESGTMQIHQLAVNYQAEQDRLLLRVGSTAGSCSDSS